MIAILNLVDNTVDISSNGIPFPLVYRTNTKQIEVLELTGVPLGFMKKINPDSCLIKLESGDSLVMLTDGFHERMNHHKEIWGYSTVSSCLSKICKNNSQAQVIVDELFTACDEFANGLEPNDDLTIVVLGI